MSLLVFILLAAGAVLVIAYPLLPGRVPAEPARGASDAEVERAVRRLRQAQAGGGQACPACGAAHQAGDRFCVRCGQTLPGVEAAACPACGSALRPEDQFCARCGHNLAVEEVA